MNAHPRHSLEKSIHRFFDFNESVPRATAYIKDALKASGIGLLGQYTAHACSEELILKMDKFTLAKA